MDELVLLSPSGKKMYRELDLIDVWFDSGSMPYAQWHYPFENQEVFKNNFPADFIAEGVDQTRGWFYTLHAIAVMVFDSVPSKRWFPTASCWTRKATKCPSRKATWWIPSRPSKPMAPTRRAGT
jgi:isoleucyl-tRNA synthetase